MTIPGMSKTIALALALIVVAVSAASQSPSSQRGGVTKPPDAARSNGLRTGTVPGSSVISPGTTSLLNPALNPPIAPSPADPSPPTVNANAPNLAIHQGGAGSGPLR
jgi:hypothetical protein